MSAPRTVVVFVFADPWMQQMVREAAPPEFGVRFLEDPADSAQVRDLLPQADFLVTIDLPAAWVPLLRQCRLVQHQGVGFDGIDVAALARAGIPLAITPEGTINGVAEHTILFILALYKQLTVVHESMRQGRFDRVGWRKQCHFFQGKTLGLVGFGRIGRRVAQLAQVFDVEVCYSDVQRASAAVEQELRARHVPLDNLLASVDVVSVHTPLTAETRGLFGAEQFRRMKPGALFINTSRGGTYDMDALYESLRAGHLGGAGLDVFNPQPPPPGHPILQLPNVVCTPHMATGTVEAHREKAQAQFENFRRVLRGEAAQNLIQG